MRQAAGEHAEHRNRPGADDLGIAATEPDEPELALVGADPRPQVKGLNKKTMVDLEGQLSNPDKTLRTLVPQGLSATSAAHQGSRTTQKRARTRRETRPSNKLGHYSNPAPPSTGEQLSARDGATPPPATTHRTQRRLRSAEVEALVDQYHAGATITQLVETFRISRTTVMAHLDRKGVQRRAVAKQWDRKKLASAARSYSNGSSLATIAAQFGLDPSTVANRFRRAGVPIRPRRGWD